MIRFFSKCIICGSYNKFKKVTTYREADNCNTCSSTWRCRSIGLGVQFGLGYNWKPFPVQFPNWSIECIGIGDDVNLVSCLSKNFSYTNTHVDKFPQLDLKSDLTNLSEMFNFVTCSDVLEHVIPPVSIAFENLFKIIKSNGFLVLSVPVDVLSEETVEFYPELKNFEVIDEKVHWTNSNGIEMIDENPEWHGGRGITLAFRVWSEKDLIQQLTRVGFKNIEKIPFSPNNMVPFLSGAGTYIARKS